MLNPGCCHNPRYQSILINHRTGCGGVSSQDDVENLARNSWLDTQHHWLDSQHHWLDTQHHWLDTLHHWLDTQHHWLDSQHHWLDSQHHLSMYRI